MNKPLRGIYFVLTFLFVFGADLGGISGVPPSKLGL